MGNARYRTIAREEITKPKLISRIHYDSFENRKRTTIEATLSTILSFFLSFPWKRDRGEEDRNLGGVVGKGLDGLKARFVARWNG